MPRPLHWFKWQAYTTWLSGAALLIVVYYLGGLYLLSQGVGVMGSTGGRRGSTLLFWALVGLVPLLGVPYLLRAPRRWFERWILSRRDFARVVAAFLAFLLPRLSRPVQNAGDRTLGVGQRAGGKAPGLIGRLFSKSFGTSRRAVNKSGSA